MSDQVLYWVVVLGVPIAAVLVGLGIGCWVGGGDRDKHEREMLLRARARRGRSLTRGETFTGRHAGTTFVHFIERGTGKGPTNAVVAIPSKSPGEFLVQSEHTPGIALAKRLRLVEEFQTGDKELDEWLYFSGSTDAYVKAVFADRDNLRCLRALEELGFDRFEKTDGELRASQLGRGLLDPRELAAAVGLLAKLKLPETVEGGGLLEGRRALYLLRGIVALIVLTGIAGYDVSKPLLDGWSPFVPVALPGMAAICLAVLAGGWALIRGRSMAATGMQELLYSISFVALASIGLQALANQQLDRSEAQVHEARIIARHGGKRLSLEVESWRGRGSERLFVSESVYETAKPGEIWTVRVRAGAVGQPWIESMSPRPR